MKEKWLCGAIIYRWTDIDTYMDPHNLCIHSFCLVLYVFKYILYFDPVQFIEWTFFYCIGTKHYIDILHDAFNGDQNISNILSSIQCSSGIKGVKNQLNMIRNGGESTRLSFHAMDVLWRIMWFGLDIMFKV